MELKMTSSGAPPKKVSPLRLSRSLAAVGGGLITLALSVSTIEFSSEVSVLGIGTSPSILAKGVGDPNEYSISDPDEVVLRR
jgi:hypothetical protein